MRIFFSVGEPSGDLHGANLIRRLRERAPSILCEGFGGPRMAAAGCRLDHDLTRHATMFFSEALWKLPTFLSLASQAEQAFKARRPDAVVLIDYPGFNWHIARLAKKHRVPVYYYGVPQLWAWAPWRIGKMRRYVDHALCKLPFEAQWYASRGCPATDVGHPYFDELAEQQLDQEFMSRFATSGPLVTILPGSRRQEIAANLPAFLKAAGVVLRQRPETRFAIAAFNEEQAERARGLVSSAALPIEVHVGRTPELIEAARCTMACSGSVSLELLWREKPSVVHYRVPWHIQWLARRLMNVRYITIANILAADDAFEGPRRPYDPQEPGAEKLPFPEYPTCEDKSDALATHVLKWLDDPREHARVVELLRALKSRFARTGASERAADWLFQRLTSRTASAA